MLKNKISISIFSLIKSRVRKIKNKKCKIKNKFRIGSLIKIKRINQNQK